MQLVGDPSYRTWALPYSAKREEPGTEGVYPQGPEIDSRTLFRIRLHCQFANPGSHTSVMFLTEGFSERLHVAIENPTTDVSEMIPRLVKPEKFPEDWFPIYHFEDLPSIFFELNLNYKYLRIQGNIVYLNLNLLTEPINHAPIYYTYSRNFLAFLKLVEKRGLIRTTDLNFVQSWQLRPATVALLSEAEDYLADFEDLYLPTISLSSSFLRDRLQQKPYYYSIGCSPVYIHFLALKWRDQLWLVNGNIELPMEKLSDYLQLNQIRSTLVEAQGSVFRIAANVKLPQHPEPISETFYYFGPNKTKMRSLLYPPNAIPSNLVVLNT